jgi:hypothetical protein
MIGFSIYAQPIGGSAWTGACSSDQALDGAMAFTRPVVRSRSTLQLFAYFDLGNGSILRSTRVHIIILDVE